MSTEIPQVRIGELLMQAGIVSTDSIKEALAQFEARGLPIGKALVMSGYLSEQELRGAIELQSMVNDGVLPLDVSVQVLKLSRQKKIPLGQAFQELGLVEPEHELTNKLGQLLVASDCVSVKQLEEALQTNKRTGLPLGHIFCFSGLVSQPIIHTTLLVQTLIRKGVVPRTTGIHALRMANERENHLAKLPINNGYIPSVLIHTPKLGELLVESQILISSLLNESLTRTLNSQKPLGEILLKFHYVPLDLVEGAIEIQEIVDNNIIDKTQAKQALIAMSSKEDSLDKAIAEAATFSSPTNTAKTLLELLTVGGIVAINDIPRDVQERCKVNYNQTPQVCKHFLTTNIFNEQFLYRALRCAHMIELKKMNLEQAIMVLDLAYRDNVTLDQALFEKAYVKRTRLRDPQMHERMQAISGSH